jgi:hypothetical protein
MLIEEEVEAIGASFLRSRVAAAVAPAAAQAAAAQAAAAEVGAGGADPRLLHLAMLSKSAWEAVALGGGLAALGGLGVGQGDSGRAGARTGLGLALGQGMACRREQTLLH